MTHRDSDNGDFQPPPPPPRPPHALLLASFTSSAIAGLSPLLLGVTGMAFSGPLFLLAACLVLRTAIAEPAPQFRTMAWVALGAALVGFFFYGFVLVNAWRRSARAGLGLLTMSAISLIVLLLLVGVPWALRGSD